MQNTQQPLRTQHQRIAVCQKHPTYPVPIIRISQRHLPRNLFIGKDLERNAPVHIAVRTLVMGAAPGHPQNKTVGLAGRTKHRGIIIIKKHEMAASFFLPLL